MTSEGNGWLKCTIPAPSSYVMFHTNSQQEPGANETGYLVSGEAWVQNKKLSFSSKVITSHIDAATGEKIADDEDYRREFLDLKIAVKIVDDIDEAIAHINRFGTGHSECIVTEYLRNAEKFQREVDAAAVYVNASTRFTDGFEFGLGAEIGISTQKLHVRGPMGLEALTTFKYLVNGNGQTRG